jgi:hypothetical protein
VAGKNCPYPYPKNRNKKRAKVKNMEQIIKHKAFLFRILLTLVVLIGVYGFGKQKYIDKNGVYTTGVVENTTGTRGGWSGNYYYYVGDKKYTGSTIADEFTKNTKNLNITVKHLPNYPSIHYVEIK